MNTVILTLVLFFNGTTHIITEDFSYYTNPATNLRSCWRVAGELQKGVDGIDIDILSIQCTVKPLKE